MAHPTPVTTSGSRYPWANGLLTCFISTDDCFLGSFLPCLLFGKTQSRLKNTDAGDYSYLNRDCLCYALLSCGCQGCLLAQRRYSMRERFDIVGSGYGDCLASCFCHCCVLIQMEREMVQSILIEAGGYQSFSGMAYQQQQ
ncbi:PLAC8 family protein [Aspergillus foveolatus]|uniref:PLAC8 family protein n=1 Tax=Aspergillus foveolatus TaxID=210207 RepID=UPI003CCCBADE